MTTNYLTSKRQFLTLLFMIFVLNCILTQNNFDTDDICEISTDGNGNSKGIKLKLNIPCEWLEYDGKLPSVVKKFGFALDDKYDTKLTQITIINLVVGVTSTMKPPADIFSIENLKRNIPPGSIFISGGISKVDGLESGETISKTVYPSANNNLIGYTLNYMTFYSNKVINISYGVTSSDDKNSQLYFNKYQKYFRFLSSKTEILNKNK